MWTSESAFPQFKALNPMEIRQSDSAGALSGSCAEPKREVPSCMR